MKNNYNPYPHNNERFGTLQFEDYMEYERKFYTDKGFHIKRLQIGKKKLLESGARLVLYGAITGACVVGAIIHGIDIVSPTINMTSSHIANIFVNSTALIISSEIAVDTIKYGIIQEAIFRNRVKSSMEASSEMVKRLSK